MSVLGFNYKFISFTSSIPESPQCLSWDLITNLYHLHQQNVLLSLEGGWDLITNLYHLHLVMCKTVKCYSWDLITNLYHLHQCVIKRFEF